MKNKGEKLITQDNQIFIDNHRISEFKIFRLKKKTGGCMKAYSVKRIIPRNNEKCNFIIFLSKQKLIEFLIKEREK